MKTLTFIFAMLLFVSCASKQREKEIQTKVSQEQVTDGPALGEKLQEVVSNSTTLTEKQKAELTRIFTETREKSQALSQESFKLRSVLIKELLNKQADNKEVRMIKKKIRKSENERLQITLNAIDKISRIVSGDPQRDLYLDHLMAIDRFN